MISEAFKNLVKNQIEEMEDTVAILDEQYIECDGCGLMYFDGDLYSRGRDFDGDHEVIWVCQPCIDAHDAEES